MTPSICKIMLFLTGIRAIVINIENGMNSYIFNIENVTYAVNRSKLNVDLVTWLPLAKGKNMTFANDRNANIIRSPSKMFKKERSNHFCNIS